MVAPGSSSTASADGAFVAVLPAQPAALNRTLTVRADGPKGGSITLTNVAFGDLYWCSGQVSNNMETLDIYSLSIYVISIVWVHENIGY